MRYALKHRLIGAAVLAAVAVLLLPSFLTEKRDYQVNTRSQIPAAPKLVLEEFKAPQPVPNIEPAPAPETMFVPTEAIPEEDLNASSSVPGSSSPGTSKPNTSLKAVKNPEAPLSTVPAMPLNQQGLPDAWVVQVGSFTTKDAANKLRDDLQADGQKAYVRTTSTGGSVISRVYIGPKLDKSQAVALKEQMDKRLKVKSLVMRFQP